MIKGTKRIHRVAILQSNYIPWKGYFDIIDSVDTFVIYDEVQYTRRDWRNRNKIKTPNGTIWLTIPVETKGRYEQKISEVMVSDASWNKRHWETIKRSYKKAPFFNEYSEIFEDLFLNCREDHLSSINLRFINGINKILGIKTEIIQSSDFVLSDDKNLRLLNICKDLDADSYLSGPAAKDYLDEELFRDSGIDVEWMDYSGYLKYNQLYPPFEHGVSIIDLIFNTGRDARKYMKSKI